MIETVRASAVIALICVFVGCSGTKIPEMAEVNGTLKANGQPLDNVRVKFLPDPEEENFGQPSSGITNQNGEFVLEYDGKEGVKGAAIGWHRVILTDITAINTSRDPNPSPRRFDTRFTQSQSTPLKVEVKAADGQSFDLTVDPPR